MDGCDFCAEVIVIFWGGLWGLTQSDFTVMISKCHLANHGSDFYTAPSGHRQMRNSRATPRKQVQELCDHASANKGNE